MRMLSFFFGEETTVSSDCGCRSETGSEGARATRDSQCIALDCAGFLSEASLDCPSNVM